MHSLDRTRSGPTLMNVNVAVRNKISFRVKLLSGLIRIYDFMSMTMFSRA